jgi:hypothetical protein
MSTHEGNAPAHEQSKHHFVPTSLSGAARPDLDGDETTLARDRSIRSHLRWRLERETQGAADTVVVDELGVAGGLARLDLAVLNGVIHGFEIKSESDSLARLPHQIEHFSDVADFMTLVVVDQFEASALEAIPGWWGLAIARRRGKAVFFEMRRECAPNPAVVVPSFLEFLWRDEAYALLAEHGSVHRLKTATKDRLYRELAQQITWGKLHDLVLRTLRLRVSAGRSLPRT